MTYASSLLLITQLVFSKRLKPLLPLAGRPTNKTIAAMLRRRRGTVRPPVLNTLGLIAFRGSAAGVKTVQA